MATQPLDAQTRMNMIVEDYGNKAVRDHIRVLWDSKTGYSYDLDLQELHVRLAVVRHLIGNLDNDDDPKYDVTTPDGKQNREMRRIELTSARNELIEQIKGYVVPGTGGGGPTIVDLDAMAPQEFDGWINPNSPAYYGSPFYDAYGTRLRR